MTFKEALIECINGEKITHPLWEVVGYLVFTDAGFKYEDGRCVDVNQYCQSVPDEWEIYKPKVLKFPVVFKYKGHGRYAVSHNYYKSLEEFQENHPDLEPVQLLEDLGEFFEED